jgi:hypothetical protein
MIPAQEAAGVSAMIGRQDRDQGQLFYEFSLDLKTMALRRLGPPTSVRADCVSGVAIQGEMFADRAVTSTQQQAESVCWVDIEKGIASYAYICYSS